MRQDLVCEYIIEHILHELNLIACILLRAMIEDGAAGTVAERGEQNHVGFFPERNVIIVMCFPTWRCPCSASYKAQDKLV